MNGFVNGAIMLGFAVVGLYFWRFWKESSDRLFLLFSLSFWAMCANRIALAMIGTQDELRTYLYFVRLVAFLLIIFAIVDKNMFEKRSKSPSTESDSGG